MDVKRENRSARNRGRYNGHEELLHECEEGKVKCRQCRMKEMRKGDEKVIENEDGLSSL